MRFFRFEGRKQVNPIEGLHPAFGLRQGPWYFNRKKDYISDTGLDIKSRFAFDSTEELQETEFLAKIGVNKDDSIPHKFIGFAYANSKDREALEAYANRFPWAELITDLDREGEYTEASQHIPLKG
jgi:hypothetical protein